MELKNQSPKLALYLDSSLVANNLAEQVRRENNQTLPKKLFNAFEITEKSPWCV